MEFFKKIFRGWNVFELVYLGCIIVSPVFCAVYFKSGILELFSTLCALLSALFMAKGKWAAYPLAIVYSLIYAYVSFSIKLYGETMIALIILLPIALYGLFNWYKNICRENAGSKVVTVNKIKLSEYFWAVGSQIILIAGYYFLLKTFNTEFPLISAFSVTSGILAAYFLARRSESGMYFYILNDLILITLWSFMISNGSPQYITLLLTPVLLIVNDIYGIYNWNKIKKAQNNPVNQNDN